VMTQLGELNRDESIDRRRFLRRAGTVAWTTPLIMTVIASRAGAQVECLQQSAICSPTSPPPCCAPNICCPPGTTHALQCKLPNGVACSGNGNCCSGNCAGTGQNKTCQ
jgi:hypothetical protein